MICVSIEIKNAGITRIPDFEFNIEQRVSTYESKVTSQT